MAGLYNLMILGVLLIGVVVSVEGVTDQQFQELSNLVKGLQDENKGLSSLVKRLQYENQKQFALIDQLQAALKVNSPQFEAESETQTVELVQNTTIEERVTLLELQMTDVHDDVALLFENDDFLFDEQVIQDERILTLEQTSDAVTVELFEINEDIESLNFRVTVLEENGGSDGNSSISELEERVEALEGTATDHETRITTSESGIEDLQEITDDHETRLTSAEENIQGLEMTDISHDARITALEENGGGGGGSQNETIAFYALLTAYDTISTGDTLLFNQIELNEGDGYDSTTGVFTVPPGGDGTYYFSTNLCVASGETGEFYMRLNDEGICYAVGDHGDPDISDFAQSSCSAVLDVVEGDEVKVEFNSGTDTTPLYESSSIYTNGFTGFRI